MAVHNFKVALVDFSMLDDQKTVVHAVPVGNLNGLIPTWTDAPTGVVTLDPTIDATGLSCAVLGIKGVAGTVAVTVSVTNADGSIATGVVNFTQTLDPTELNVTSFDVTVDPPIAQ